MQNKRINKTDKLMYLKMVSGVILCLNEDQLF